MKTDETKETIKALEKTTELVFPLENIVAMKQAIKIMKKQIPKLVIQKDKDYLCPECKNLISDVVEWNEKDIRIIPQYCKFCGQRVV